jgi:hypothetical protein
MLLYTEFFARVIISSEHVLILIHARIEKFNPVSEIMEEPVIKKLKILWELTNFTREKLESYDLDKYVGSSDFEIILGNNKTKW